MDLLLQAALLNKIEVQGTGKSSGPAQPSTPEQPSLSSGKRKRTTLASSGDGEGSTAAALDTPKPARNNGGSVLCMMDGCDKMARDKTGR
jgi:hypothetical protein